MIFHGWALWFAFPGKLAGGKAAALHVWELLACESGDDRFVCGRSETQQCASDVQLCIVQCVSVWWDRSRWVIDTAGITLVHVARFSRISTRWWLGRCGSYWTIQKVKVIFVTNSIKMCLLILQGINFFCKIDKELVNNQVIFWKGANISTISLKVHFLNHVVYVEFVMCWLLLIRWWSGVHFDQWLLLQRPIRSIGTPPSFLSIMSLKDSSKSYPGKFCLIMHTIVVGWLKSDQLSYREVIYWKYGCVTRALLLYFIRSWVALSFKVCESVSAVSKT